MAELIFEILSDEIPSRMQLNAKEQLLNLATDKLQKNSITYTKINTFVSPRRLVLFIDSLYIDSSKVTEVKGPRVDANHNAIEGFASKYGKKVHELERRSTDKGEFFFIVSKASSNQIDEILRSIIQEIIHEFAWPKSMRWGSLNETWIRPIKHILCLFDGKVLPISYAGIKAGRISYGNRMLSEGSFEVRYLVDYMENLRKRFVMLDFAEKVKFIVTEIKSCIQDKSLVWKEDNRLLEEVAGLVEWPKVLIGSIKDEFLSIPDLITTTAMKVHQRYFPLYYNNGELAPYFIVVANCDPRFKDSIIQGNEKVLNARLSDAKFFFEHDLKKNLMSLLPKLNNITFHEKLGTMYEKVERITKISLLLSMWIPGADLDKVESAAQMSKCDLVTNVVKEFPELQGYMGKIYAYNSGYDKKIADAIKEHYLPIGPDSEVPTVPESIAVALADKLDSIISFFIIGEKPTSSKDPYALRRSAIGIIRILIENKIMLPMNVVMSKIIDMYLGIDNSSSESVSNKIDRVSTEVIEFLLDRLRFYLKAIKIKPEFINSIVPDNNHDNVYLIFKKIMLLEEIAKNDTLKEGIQALIRVSNIINSTQNVEKLIMRKVNSSIFETDEERELYEAIDAIKIDLQTLYKNDDYKGYIVLITGLKEYINQFFDKVIVNAEKDEIRKNRLTILKMIADASKQIADFSVISF